MKLNWINRKKSKSRSIALGTFDGVHRGHQCLLKKTVASRTVKGSSCAFTFDLPPEQYFRGPARLINSFEDKLKLIAKTGIDEIAWLPFDEELASLKAEEFVSGILVEQLCAEHIICGFNHRFGRGQAGDIQLLQALGKRHGFKVTAVGPVKSENAVISSTAIRKMISAGELKAAAQSLGYFPFYHGKVVRGAGRGKQLGFPTANLEIDPRLVLPGEGVYLAWCILPDQRGVPSVVSVGKNPTFAGAIQTTEAYILDFNGDLYEQSLEVRFLERIRDITRYEAPRDLQRQIEADVHTARRLLKGYHLQGKQIVLR